MPFSKSPDQLLIEEFIGVELIGGTDSLMESAQIFDGAMFWSFFLHEHKQLLFIIASTEESMVRGSVMVALEINYANLSIEHIPEAGEALIILPQRSEETPNSVQFLKTPEGPFYVTATFPKA